MEKTAIIGGTGLDRLSGMTVTGRKVVRTPYGDPSGVLVTGEIFGKEFTFLPRHGSGHTIPPHAVNYRANIWALKDVGVLNIVAFAAVGGISEESKPGAIVVPDQLIDYTYGREHTFFDGDAEHVHHVDFTEPYTPSLRRKLLRAARSCGVDVVEGGTYAATQGPRLETTAEIIRLERDGATIVGMTGMPEAALARELAINYACVAIVVNPAAGKSDQPITLEAIGRHLAHGAGNALTVLGHL